jgi:ferredoxin
MKVTVIKKKCPAQKDICKVIPICPTGAIRYQADEGEPLGGVIVIDETLCNECGKCVTECCGQAIEIR